jgi:hypothetical protein
MFLIILSILDILAGLSLLFPNLLSAISFYLGIIVSLKGLSSLVGGISMKEFLFVVLGFVDILVGIMLLFSFSIPWLWILPMIKGVYSFIVGLGSR